MQNDKEIDAGAIRVRDIEISFLAGGTSSSGTPIVFVHGLGEDSTSWASQLEEFSGDRPTYSVDVRGHGLTDLGKAEGTIQQLADDLLGFLKTIGPSVCVGFSMGGAIVLAAAAADDEGLVAHAVAVCTSSVVGGRAAQRFLERAEGIESNGKRFAQDALLGNLERNVLTRPLNFNDEVACRLRAIGDGKGYANGARAMASMREVPLTDKLGTVDCPVDVLLGELDSSCPPKAGEIIVEAVPQGALRSMPGVGHFVNIEHPPTLTRALRDLLALTTSASEAIYR